MNIFNMIFDYVTVVVLKLIAKLPTNSLQLDSYLDVLKVNLGYVNWFVPFNEIYTIFLAWSSAIMIVITAFVFIKIAIKGRG